MYKLFVKPTFRKRLQKLHAEKSAKKKRARYLHVSSRNLQKEEIQQAQAIVEKNICKQRSCGFACRSVGELHKAQPPIRSLQRRDRENCDREQKDGAGVADAGKKARLTACLQFSFFFPLAMIIPPIDGGLADYFQLPSVSCCLTGFPILQN